MAAVEYLSASELRVGSGYTILFGEYRPQLNDSSPLHPSTAALPSTQDQVHFGTTVARIGYYRLALVIVKSGHDLVVFLGTTRTGLNSHCYVRMHPDTPRLAGQPLMPPPSLLPTAFASVHGYLNLTHKFQLTVQDPSSTNIGMDSFVTSLAPQHPRMEGLTPSPRSPRAMLQRILAWHSLRCEWRSGVPQTGWR